jgi:hypothetical protein
MGTGAGHQESLIKGAERALSGAGREAVADSPELIVCSLFEDQRPLRGMAGALDWRLRGFLSRFVISGRITGAKKEIVYIPIRHREAMRHILLVGLGSRRAERTGTTELELLSETVVRLGMKRVLISRSSFPFEAFGDEARVKKKLKDVDVEFAI